MVLAQGGPARNFHGFGTLNFSGVRVLIIDSDVYAVRLVSQILRGFGSNDQTAAETGAEARRLLSDSAFDLIICESVLPDATAADLLRWIRHHEETDVKFAPVIVLAGYTQASALKTAWDSGANNVVKKPVSPVVLLDHIAWSARTARPFVESSAYRGPDRRFKYAGPPDAIGRRDADLPLEMGDAAVPTMTKGRIEALLGPNKVPIL